MKRSNFIISLLSLIFIPIGKIFGITQKEPKIYAIAKVELLHGGIVFAERKKIFYTDDEIVNYVRSQQKHIINKTDWCSGQRSFMSALISIDYEAGGKARIFERLKPTNVIQAWEQCISDYRS